MRRYQAIDNYKFKLKSEKKTNLREARDLKRFSLYIQLNCDLGVVDSNRAVLDVSWLVTTLCKCSAQNCSKAGV